MSWEEDEIASGIAEDYERTLIAQSTDYEAFYCTVRERFYKLAPARDLAELLFHPPRSPKLSAAHFKAFYDNMSRLWSRCDESEAGLYAFREEVGILLAGFASREPPVIVSGAQTAVKQGTTGASMFPGEDIRITGDAFYLRPSARVLSDGQPKELTIYFEAKWYSLLTNEKGFVKALDYGALEPFAAKLGVSAYVDHCPNPAAVVAYAEAHGYHVPELALELIVGRWMLEARDYNPWEPKDAETL